MLNASGWHGTEKNRNLKKEKKKTSLQDRTKILLGLKKFYISNFSSYFLKLWYKGLQRAQLSNVWAVARKSRYNSFFQFQVTNQTDGRVSNHHTLRSCIFFWTLDKTFNFCQDVFWKPLQRICWKENRQMRVWRMFQQHFLWNHV